jgi:branched-chain amino acid transport system ATP-binding protein
MEIDTEHILVASDITKRFGGLTALDRLNVSVRKGDIHAIIGPNGSGKTTFINVITGMYPATSGKVRFEGLDITHMAAYEISQEGICRTFQRGIIAPDLRVLDNVMLGMHVKTKADVKGTFFRLPFTTSYQEDRIKRTSIELLDLVGMKESANRWAKELVWVERQLVQIARAIAGEPKLLLLDEPTSGMGERESVQVEDVICKIREQFKTTVVVVAHDIRLVQSCADIVTCIDFGKFIAQGTAKEVSENPQVKEAYLGKGFESERSIGS